VSGLSPYIRHRLLSEWEVLASVLARHSPSAAEKFVQEVFWRSYWKGWLEHRPQIWSAYLREVEGCEKALDERSDLEANYRQAVAGGTGIEPFDAWVRELQETGYLHNHARMWFASIWIFTLELPWPLGADFFLRHLLDGDPASNTLSWRWVAGLHTRGKTYLATEHNLHRFAGDRFFTGSPPGGMERLAGRAAALTADPHPPAVAPSWPEHREPEGKAGLLLTEEDLHLDVPISPAAVGALCIDPDDSVISTQVCGFKAAAVEDALTRARKEFPDASVRRARFSVREAVGWARGQGLKQVWVAWAPQGHVRPHLDALKGALDEAGIELVRFVRDYDRLIWPHCSKGFFQLNKRIPELLGDLIDSEPQQSRLPFTSGS
jgi:deoxyribodipyrimidine photo-lyase